MAPGRISDRIVVDRIDWIKKMIHEIGQLPFDSYASFIADKRNIWAAESCLRRALEALMDLGRHILAKGFGRGVSEYKEIAAGLVAAGIFGPDEGDKLRTLAGYRNRMVHFYQEISDKELFEICSSQLSDITCVTDAIREWISVHHDMIDKTL
ncbi:conserved hypothetical protein [uncultured Desulfobacterium sp.]|uniref:DUF86 domain-containing protein n=1 Tax=uncultured Desulfobacterium sp. TaxID=201089 RepID=A0A445MX38_9BACT|nr:conserved hypothetical protein [uncultured Desulfobacterium sp.]